MTASVSDALKADAPNPGKVQDSLPSPNVAIPVFDKPLDGEEVEAQVKLVDNASKRNLENLRKSLPEKTFADYMVVRELETKHNEDLANVLLKNAEDYTSAGMACAIPAQFPDARRIGEDSMRIVRRRAGK